jgi:hypothetical protein
MLLKLKPYDTHYYCSSTGKMWEFIVVDYINKYVNVRWTHNDYTEEIHESSSNVWNHTSVCRTTNEAV